MSHAEATWSEGATEIYRQLAAIAVPRRAEQISALVTLAPFAVSEEFRVVELGCGEGLLTHALLEVFPRATALALDGSANMRAAAARRSSATSPS